MYRTFTLKKYYVVGVTDDETLVKDDIVIDDYRKITYENVGFHPAIVKYLDDVNFTVDFDDNEFLSISHVMEKNAPGHVTRTFSGFSYKAKLYNEKTEEIEQVDGYRPGSFDEKTTSKMRKEYAEKGYNLLKLTNIEVVKELRGLKVADFLAWARANNKLG